MVQSAKPLRLYGLTREEFSQVLEICGSSPSGLRWKVTVNPRAVKGYVAGSYSRTVKFPCWRLKYNKTAMILSRVLWFMGKGTYPDIIDHKDGNPYNHEIDNLRNTDIGVNCTNRKVSNTTGVPGVYFVSEECGKEGWRCQGVVDGVRWAKYFSVRKYGDSARGLAIAHRLMRESLDGIQTRRATIGTDS